MKLGVCWGSGLAEPKIVDWAGRHAATGGWRGRFGTDLWDDPQGLENALDTQALTWTYVLETGEPAYGVTGADFLSTCEAAGLPAMLVLDPMYPGGLDGTGYHDTALEATISFPDFRQQDLEAFAGELLALVRQNWPKLRISGVQWGNEVEYLPYETAWRDAYAQYYDGLLTLARVVAECAPETPVIVGGDSGARRFTIDVDGDRQSRKTLVWYCGRRARGDWPASSAPLALDFHADLLVKKPPVSPSAAAALAKTISDDAARLVKTFELPVYVTECAGYNFFSELGGAAAGAGVEAFWGVACRWLVPEWGALKSPKNDTRAMGCFGLPDWDNGPTRESFEALSRALAPSGSR